MQFSYVTDEYGNSTDFARPVTIPKGASFEDMISLKGKNFIGDKINTYIIQPLIGANTRRHGIPCESVTRNRSDDAGMCSRQLETRPGARNAGPERALSATRAGPQNDASTL